MLSLPITAKVRRFTFSMRRVIAAKGVSGLAGMAWRRLFGLPVIPEPRLLDSPFDRLHGVKTSGLIHCSEDEEQSAYYGVSPSVFRECCRRWIATLSGPTAVTQYCFLDLGSGLGRAVLMASELPFRDVSGVELNADLVAIAQNNVRTWIESGRARAPIHLSHQDVRDFDYPPAPALIFLYNPFGEATLLQVLDRLRQVYATRAAAVDILYCYPKYGYVLDEQAGIKQLWMAAIPLSEEDKAADAFYTEREVCALYRFQGLRKT